MRKDDQQEKQCHYEDGTANMKFKNFKESAAENATREKIKSEKEADKVKHDRMLDSARRRDVQAKNRMEEVEQVEGYKKPTPAEIAADKKKDMKGKPRPSVTASSLRKKVYGEEVELDEAKSTQDQDIKDREGTQPAAYHKGLKKGTKVKRDAHFKKHGPKDDNDASAYKDAPGDKEARKKGLRKSKYTQFVNRMMTMDEKTKWGEEVEQVDEGVFSKLKNAKKALVQKKKDFDYDKKNAAYLKRSRARDQKEIDLVVKGDSRSKNGKSDNPHKAAHIKRALARADSRIKNWKLPRLPEEVEQVEEGIEYHAHGKVFKKKGEAIAHHVKKLGNKANYNHEVHRVDTKTNTITHGFDGEGRSKHLGFNKAKYDKLSAGKPIGEEVEQINENSFAEKSKKSGISTGTLKKVYDRGVAAWKTGHRPGTTPQQWGHSRVNAFIAKKKKGGLNHDKDLA